MFRRAGIGLGRMAIAMAGLAQPAAATFAKEVTVLKRRRAPSTSPPSAWAWASQ